MALLLVVLIAASACMLALNLATKDGERLTTRYKQPFLLELTLRAFFQWPLAQATISDGDHSHVDSRHLINLALLQM